MEFTNKKESEEFKKELGGFSYVSIGTTHSIYFRRNLYGLIICDKVLTCYQFFFFFFTELRKEQ